jgi:hypothetical protein
MPKVGLLLTFVLASAAVACSGSGSGGDGGPPVDGGHKRDGARDAGADRSATQDGPGHPGDGGSKASCACAAMGLVCAADGGCAPCTSNGECQAYDSGTPACQLGQHDSGSYQHCVACTSTVACPSGQVCDLSGVDDPTGIPSARTPDLCYPDCRTHPGTCSPGVSYCSPDSGLCGFGCISTENACAPVGQKCNLDAGICVACLTPADCPIDQPGCLANQCGNCASNADCPMGQACDVPFGLCHCSDSAECAFPAPACYVHVHANVDGSVDLGCGCVLDAGACPDDTLCNRGTGLNDGGLCLPRCGHDGGPSCSAEGRVCHPDSGLCGPCTNAAECANSSNGTICVTDGGLKGTCTCEVGVASSCPSGTVCNPPLGCTTSCVVDGGACLSGICDKTTGTCRGCVQTSDCAHNPAGKVCNNGDGGSFTCICHTPADCLDAGEGCSTQLQLCGICDVPTDCPSSNPGCNSQTATCGSCSASTDCPTSLPVCGDAGTCGS